MILLARNSSEFGGLRHSIYGSASPWGRERLISKVDPPEPSKQCSFWPQDACFV